MLNSKSGVGKKLWQNATKPAIPSKARWQEGVSAKNTRPLAQSESARKKERNNPKQVADEIFPRDISFSDTIGFIEMPQISNLALMWLGTVPGDNRFHEPSIEILERVPWGAA
jgi:hypothetical protein